MIDLPYPLVIETTSDADFLGFYSAELQGFSGVGHSIEECIAMAKPAMQEHVALLEERGLPVPQKNRNPTITIVNETVREAA
jgi:predicted RNase H-like HicB family nuclease